MKTYCADVATIARESLQPMIDSLRSNGRFPWADSAFDRAKVNDCMDQIRARLAECGYEGELKFQYTGEGGDWDGYFYDPEFEQE